MRWTHFQFISSSVNNLLYSILVRNSTETLTYPNYIAQISNEFGKISCFCLFIFSIRKLCRILIFCASSDMMYGCRVLYENYRSKQFLKVSKRIMLRSLTFSILGKHLLNFLKENIHFENLKVLYKILVLKKSLFKISCKICEMEN